MFQILYTLTIVSSSIDMALNLKFNIAKRKFCLNSRKEVRERWNKTIKVYNLAEEFLSITQIARLYMVSKATLYCEINSHCV